MYIEYCTINSYHRDDSVSFLWTSDPFAGKRAYEAEIINKYGKHDPTKPPIRERGDIYILLGALIGMVIGGVLAGVISYHYLGFVGIFLITGGSSLAGGIIGATVGNFIKKWRRKVREKKYSDSLRYQG